MARDPGRIGNDRPNGGPHGEPGPRREPPPPKPPLRRRRRRRPPPPPPPREERSGTRWD